MSKFKYFMTYTITNFFFMAHMQRERIGAFE